MFKEKKKVEKEKGVSLLLCSLTRLSVLGHRLWRLSHVGPHFYKCSTTAQQRCMQVTQMQRLETTDQSASVNMLSFGHRSAALLWATDILLQGVRPWLLSCAVTISCSVHHVGGEERPWNTNWVCVYVSVKPASELRNNHTLLRMGAKKLLCIIFHFLL